MNPWAEGDEPETCIKCERTVSNCDCTGGPETEPDCTCYELTGGHQPGCYFNAIRRVTPSNQDTE